MNTNEFQKLSDILSDDILKPKEFDTPCISIYDPKTYTYNDYDQKNLSTIAEKMPDRTIIAICSPCKLDFLDAFIFADPNQKAKLCKTIELFTKMFPDLNRYVSKRNNQTIFEVRTFAGSIDQAKLISENWKNNAYSIYPKLLSLLTGKE